MRSSDWHADILGHGYEAKDLRLGTDPEGEGEAIATLVRYLPTDDPDLTDRPALLWVHGMTDYFFHTHVAEYFHAAGYAFYALDLRKCGRARQEGQTWHYTEDLKHYFPDLSAALGELTGAGHRRVTPIAHSTGGLIVPLWLDQLRRATPSKLEAISGVILNSPWLDLQYPAWAVRIIRPFASFFGKRMPHRLIPGGNLGTYGKSIHSSKHGVWDYDTTMKPLGGHPKSLGWLRAVLLGQKQVQNDGVDVGVPVLTVVSSKSYLGHDYSAAADTADVVLDVDQIRSWAPHLGRDVTVASIDGARHDVFLSLPHALDDALTTASEWLSHRAD